jgi:catechol 2,3-dioxygenase-like lactoylglutathione lyase family enzyme
MQRRSLAFIVAGLVCLSFGLLAIQAAPGGKGKAPIIRGWSHQYVRAIDAEKTFRFYHEVLGMRFVGSRTDSRRDPQNPKAYYYFQSGRVCVCVGGYPANPSDYEPEHMNRLYIHWEVEDVSAFYEHLRDIGYDDHTQLRTSKWGARTFTVYDPNGVAIALTEWKGKSDWQRPDRLEHIVPFPPSH